MHGEPLATLSKLVVNLPVREDQEKVPPATWNGKGQYPAVRPAAFNWPLRSNWNNRSHSPQRPLSLPLFFFQSGQAQHTCCIVLCSPQLKSGRTAEPQRALICHWSKLALLFSCQSKDSLGARDLASLVALAQMVPEHLPPRCGTPCLFSTDPFQWLLPPQFVDGQRRGFYWLF